MISIFIFPSESAAWAEMDGLGGLTRFGPRSVFRHGKTAPAPSARNAASERLSRPERSGDIHLGELSPVRTLEVREGGSCDDHLRSL